MLHVDSRRGEEKPKKIPTRILLCRIDLSYIFLFSISKKNPIFPLLWTLNKMVARDMGTLYLFSIPGAEHTALCMLGKHSIPVFIRQGITKLPGQALDL